MNGLVVIDLQGGDAAFALVDEERWKQILSIHGSWNDEEPLHELGNIIGWLTTNDPECARPERAPEVKLGSIIKTWHTQTYVVEDVQITNVIGLLTIPL